MLRLFPTILSILLRPLLAAGLLLSSRAAVDPLLLKQLAECPVADSHFDRVYAELQKSHELDPLSEEEAGKLFRGFPLEEGQRDVARGLLLEKRGKLDEARRAFAEAAAYHAGAWHLFRLGDEEPLALRLAEFDDNASHAILFRRIVADPDAAYRRETQRWLTQKLGTVRTCAVRGVLLKILAEFAFQDGKLEAFVREAEAQAVTTPAGKRASHFFAVALLHRYLYNRAAADEWMKRASEEKAQEPDMWEAVAGSLPVRGARQVEFAMLQRVLTAPGVRPAVRWNLLYHWAYSDANGLLEWLRGHPDDCVLISDWIGLESAGNHPEAIFYDPDKTVFLSAVCDRFPDNLSLKLWRGGIALNAKRTDDAARDFSLVFADAGRQWKVEAARMGKPPGFAFAEQAAIPVLQHLPLQGPSQGLDLAVRLRNAAWKQLLKTADPKSMLERVDAAGPGFFVSWDEEVHRWLEAGCTLRAWERLETVIKGGQFDLPAILRSSVSYRMNKAFSSQWVPASWKKRLLDICESLTLKAASLNSFSTVSELATIVARYGGHEAAGRLLDALKALPSPVNATPQVLDALSKAAGQDVKISNDVNRQPSAVSVQRRGRPVEPWWLRAPVGPTGCGESFMSHPDPASAMQRSPYQSASAPQIHWAGRYAVYQGKNSSFSPVEEPKGLTTEQMLRWRLARLKFSGSPYRAVHNEMLALQDITDSLLKEVPNDDLRLIRLQLAVAQLNQAGGPRPEVDPNAKELLKLLDGIQMQGGAWSLVKATLHARLLTASGDTTGAAEALEIFRTRGYSTQPPEPEKRAPGVFPPSDQSLPPPRRAYSDPFLPPNASADQRAQYEDEVAVIRIDRLMQAGPQEREEAAKLSIAILHRPVFPRSGTGAKCSAALALKDGGQWPSVLAALDKEMEGNPKSPDIPLNLFFVFNLRGSELAPVWENGVPPWVRYARHLVRNETAVHEVYETLTKWLFKEKNTREAGETSSKWMKAFPSGDPLRTETGLLLAALQEAGRSKEFTESCIRWCEASRTESPTTGTPFYSCREILKFISGIEAAGYRTEGARLLSALLKLGVVPMPGAPDFQRIGELAGRLGILPAAGRLLLDDLIPPQRELILAPDAFDFPFRRQDAYECPSSLFSSGLSLDNKMLIPAVELVKLLHGQSLLAEMEQRIDSVTGRSSFPGLDSYMGRVSRLRLIVDCVRDPAGTPARIEALAEKGEALETHILTALPGADALVYYRFLTKFLLTSAPAGDNAAQRSARITEVFRRGMPLAQEKNDLPLIHNVLRLQLREHRRLWEQSLTTGPDAGPQIDIAAFADTLKQMVTFGLAGEVVTALKDNMPLFDRFAETVGSIHLAGPAATLWKQAHATGLPELENLLFESGLRWISVASSKRDNPAQTAGALARWVKICMIAGKWDAAARQLAVLENFPAEITGMLRPSLQDLRSQLTVGTRTVEEAELLTWLTPAEDGRLLLCWHRWGLPVADRKGSSPSNAGPVMTWPVKRAGTPVEGELKVFSSSSGSSWNEVANANPLALAGSIDVAPANYFRTLSHRNGKSEFSGIFPGAKALLPAGPPGGVITVNRSNALSPVKNVPWTPLPPDERPGAWGWRAQLPAGTHSASALSKAVAFNPVKEHLFSGWVQVSGFSGTLEVLLESNISSDEEPRARHAASFMSTDGAWHFVKCGKVDLNHSGYRHYGTSVRVRLAFNVTTPDSPVSLSICDWNLAELPQDPPLPCPVRAVGGFSGRIDALALSPDGGWLAVAGDNGRLAWCPSSGEITGLLTKVPSGIRQMAIVDGGDSILCLTGKNELIRYSFAVGSTVSVHQFDPDITPFVFSPAGTAVAIRNRDQWVVWRMNGGGLARGTSIPFRDYEGIFPAFFSDDGSQLVIRGDFRNSLLSEGRSEPAFRVYSVADGSLIFDTFNGEGANPGFTVRRRDRPPPAPDFGVITTPGGWTIRVSGNGEVEARRTARPSEAWMKWLPWRSFNPTAFVLDHETGALFTGDDSGCILRWDLKLAAE